MVRAATEADVEFLAAACAACAFEAQPTTLLQLLALMRVGRADYWILEDDGVIRMGIATFYTPETVWIGLMYRPKKGMSLRADCRSILEAAWPAMCLSGAKMVRATVAWDNPRREAILRLHEACFGMKREMVQTVAPLEDFGKN